MAIGGTWEIFDKEIDGLLTTVELAKLLNISPKTVRKWRYERNLPAIKVGKRLVRYRKKDILAWLKTMEKRFEHT
jgi:excisionase family DNA binding protein